MKSSSRHWLTAIGLSCLMALVAVLGFAAGRYSIVRSFDSKIKGFARAFTLGPLLNEKDKRAICGVYRDGDKMYDRLNDISWSVPNVPAPFVGSAPAPGLHRGARINSLHFRSAREVAIPKPAGTFRIFLTGGSTAFGSGAPDEERTIAGFLSETLARELTPRTGKQYEVFTAANPAWASTHERIMIENRLSELEPDLVISFSGTNDVHWGVHGGRNVFWFRTYADEFFYNLLRRIYRLADRELAETIPASKEDVPPPVVAQRLAKNVRLSAYALAQAGVDYVFVLQPTLAATKKGLSEREGKNLRYREYFQECYALIDSALADLHEENLTYLDLSGIFDRMGRQEEIFLDSYHFGDKGNEIIARQIFDRIKEKIGT